MVALFMRVPPVMRAPLSLLQILCVQHNFLGHLLLLILIHSLQINDCWNSLKSVSMWQMWHNLAVEHVALLGLLLHLLQMDNDNKHSNDESSLSYHDHDLYQYNQNVLTIFCNPVNSDSSILPALKVFCF